MYLMRRNNWIIMNMNRMSFNLSFLPFSLGQVRNITHNNRDNYSETKDNQTSMARGQSRWGRHHQQRVTEVSHRYRSSTPSPRLLHVGGAYSVKRSTAATRKPSWKLTATFFTRRIRRRRIKKKEKKKRCPIGDSRE